MRVIPNTPSNDRIIQSEAEFVSEDYFSKNKKVPKPGENLSIVFTDAVIIVSYEMDGSTTIQAFPLSPCVFSEKIFGDPDDEANLTEKSKMVYNAEILHAKRYDNSVGVFADGVLYLQTDTLGRHPAIFFKCQYSVRTNRGLTGRLKVEDTTPLDANMFDYDNPSGSNPYGDEGFSITDLWSTFMDGDFS